MRACYKDIEFLDLLKLQQLFKRLQWNWIRGIVEDSDRVSVTEQHFAITNFAKSFVAIIIKFAKYAQLRSYMCQIEESQHLANPNLLFTSLSHEDRVDMWYWSRRYILFKLKSSISCKFSTHSFASLNYFLYLHSSGW